MIRVVHTGTCVQCGRSGKAIVSNGKCRACAKGTAEARATTKNLQPKESSTEWAKSWKPLNQRAVDMAEMRAQERLGMAVIRERED